MPTRVIIRAVPPRLKTVEYLVRHVPHAEVLVDPEYHNQSLSGNSKATLAVVRAFAHQGSGPAVHMEDDIVLTRDFVAKLEAAVAERPHSVIQFFSMRGADLTAGSRWDRSFMMAQCFYLPAGYGRELAEFIPGWVAAHPEHPGGYEIATNDWLKARGEPHWIHVPSLVQHREVVSVIDRRRSKYRSSPTFVDPEPDTP